MARGNQGSHSFTCHSHVYSQMERARASPHFGRYSFPVPITVGGWIGLGGWLHTEVVCPQKDGHPSQYWPGST